VLPFRTIQNSVTDWSTFQLLTIASSSGRWPNCCNRLRSSTGRTVSMFHWLITSQCRCCWPGCRWRINVEICTAATVSCSQS